MYSVQNGIIIVDMHQTELEECNTLYNAVFTVIDFHYVMIVRCNLFIGPDNNKSYIKFFFLNKISSFSVMESKEYLDWNGNWLPRHGCIGAEDARIFEFKSKLYMYYTMSNPKARMPLRGIEYLPLKDAILGNRRGKYLEARIFDRNQEVVEKNWIFFSNETNLLALYSIKPFILGEIVENTLVARVQRDYICVNDFKLAHLSSNAIMINNYGRKEYMFIFNEKREGEKFKYHAHIGFMEIRSPHRLLRISKEEVHININATKYTYISSLTVKGKPSLQAGKHDTIIVSGGLDDTLPFYFEFSVDYFLNQPTVQCQAENNELEFFLDSLSNQCETDNTWTIIAQGFLTILIAKWLFQFFNKRYQF